MGKSDTCIVRTRTKNVKKEEIKQICKLYSFLDGLFPRMLFTAICIEKAKSIKYNFVVPKIFFWPFFGLLGASTFRTTVPPMTTTTYLSLFHP